MRKQWCIGEIDSEFLYRMEDILDLYEQPYNPRRPVICYDERPCQLIGDVVLPLGMKPGKPQRYDYHYKRNGVCHLLIAFEPIVGWRFVQVRKHRKKRDYAEFMKELVERYYPDVECIGLVQDNLNIHTKGAFYERFCAKEAFALSQRFEFHFTPKKGSWLNMVEIELSALLRECLRGRISEIGTLEQQIQFCVERRNQRGATVKWRFTKNTAREKFKRFYKELS